MATKEDLLVLSEMFRIHAKQWTIEWNKINQTGLSRTHDMILEILATEGAQSPSRLAESLFITSGGITGVSDKLVKAGLAKRKRDEHDRRVVYLEITEEGRRVLEEIREQRNYLMKKMVGHLTDEEIQDLIRIYGKLLDKRVTLHD